MAGPAGIAIGKAAGCPSQSWMRVAVGSGATTAAPSHLHLNHMPPPPLGGQVEGSRGGVQPWWGRFSVAVDARGYSDGLFDLRGGVSMVTQAFAAFLVPPRNVVTASPASALLPASPISRSAVPLGGVPFDASSPRQRVVMKAEPGSLRRNCRPGTGRDARSGRAVSGRAAGSDARAAAAVLYHGHCLAAPAW